MYKICTSIALLTNPLSDERNQTVFPFVLLGLEAEHLDCRSSCRHALRQGEIGTSSNTAISAAYLEELARRDLEDTSYLLYLIVDLWIFYGNSMLNTLLHLSHAMKCYLYWEEVIGWNQIGFQWQAAKKHIETCGLGGIKPWITYDMSIYTVYTYIYTYVNYKDTKNHKDLIS